MNQILLLGKTTSTKLLRLMHKNIVFDKHVSTTIKMPKVGPQMQNEDGCISKQTKTKNGQNVS